MASFNKFNQFAADVANGVHKLGTDIIKVMLTDVVPNVNNAVKSDITEIAAINGYTAGGVQATQISSVQSGGVYRLFLNNVQFLATGGSLPQFRYVVLYNASSPSGSLIGWADNGSELNITLGNFFVVQFDAVNGVLSLQ